MIFYKINNILLVDRYSIDTDSLTKIHQVRGGVKTYFVTGRLEDSGQGVRTRTLPVGSCHMNGLERPVWMSEMFVQQMRVVQSFLVGILTHVLEKGSTIK